MSNVLKRLVRRYFTKQVITPVTIPLVEGTAMEGNVALIFGGSGGIGEAIAHAFVKNGCRVIITGTNEKKLQSICAAAGEACMRYVCFDVTAVNDIPSLLATAESFFGKITTVVYSAGVHCKEPFGEVTESTWDRVMDVNLKAMYFVCQEAGRYFIQNGIKGHILNVGSASGNKPGWTPYEISKWGVRSLTLGFADKWIRHGIVVNCIAPGPVATPMLGSNGDDLRWEGNPTGRMCAPEEIANLAVFMASASGDMIVGDTFYMSGGSGTICLDR